MTLLPKPYPDELIGSVLARQVRRTGLPMKVLLSEVFGPGRSNSSFLMGSALHRLAPMMGTDAKELLLSHTVFPYATAYMPIDVRGRLMEKALGAISQAECLSSITKNASHGISYRRVCRKCIQEDLRLWGETYWHRQHQLPGAGYCLKHESRLEATAIPLRGSTQKFAAELPTQQGLATVKVTLSVQSLRAFTELSVSALGEGFETPSQPLEQFRDRAAEMGYRMKSGDIAGVAVSKAFVDFYGKEFLVETGCDLAAMRPWPALMMRPNGQVPFATTKYLLMKHFLESSTSKDADSSMGYQKAGRKGRDYKRLDAVMARRLKAAINKARCSKQLVSQKKLLDEFDFGQVYRHNRDSLPLVAELMAGYREMVAGMRRGHDQ